jgi:hypothetical protein
MRKLETRMEFDMGRRASASGMRLTESDAAIAKGMLSRGDRQHDIAAWFGVNGGRIAEIANGVTFRNVAFSPTDNLPPRGPYPSGRQSAIAVEVLVAVRNAIDSAIEKARHV